MATETAQPQLDSSTISRGLLTAFRTGRSIHFLGPPGTAKTASVQALAAPAAAATVGGGAYAPDDIRVVTLDGTGLTADGLVFSLPKEVGDGWELSTVLHQALSSQSRTDDGRVRPTVLIVDDSNQSHPSVQGALKELKSDWTLGGVPLRTSLGLVGVVFADNISERHTTATLDAASGSRGAFEVVSLQDTLDGASRYLAGTYKAKPKELHKVMAWVAELPAAAQEVLNWRTVDNIMWNIAHNLPAELGIPADEEWRRAEAFDAAGKPVNDTLCDGLADAMGATRNRDMRNLRERMDAAARRDPSGASLRVIGPPGSGKTQESLSLARGAGDDVLVVNAAVSSPETLAMPVPSPDMSEMRIGLHSKVAAAAAGTPTTVIIDEVSLSPEGFLPSVYSLAHSSSRSVAGTRLDGVKVVWALENPSDTVLGDVPEAVAMPLTAASRFRSTLIETDYDFNHAYRYLRSAAYRSDLARTRTEAQAAGILGQAEPGGLEDFMSSPNADTVITAVAEQVCDWHAGLPHDDQNGLPPRALGNLIATASTRMLHVSYWSKERAAAGPGKSQERAKACLAAVQMGGFAEDVAACIPRISDGEGIRGTFANRLAITNLVERFEGTSTADLSDILGNPHQWLEVMCERDGKGQPTASAQQAASLVGLAMRTAIASTSEVVRENVVALSVLYAAVAEAVPAMAEAVAVQDYGSEQFAWICVLSKEGRPTVTGSVTAHTPPSLRDLQRLARMSVEDEDALIASDPDEYYGLVDQMGDIDYVISVYEGLRAGMSGGGGKVTPIDAAGAERMREARDRQWIALSETLRDIDLTGKANTKSRTAAKSKGRSR